MEDNLNALLELEEQLQFQEFTNEDALVLGLLIIDLAKEKTKKGIALHIEYDEYPLFTHFMEGCNHDNVYWVNAKKNVVKKFGHSSYYIGQLHKSQGTAFHEATGLSDEQFQPHGGSFPINVRGKGRVGTVTVSNLTQEEDHALAVEGIKQFLKK